MSSLFPIAAYISLAAKLTESPMTLYSLLDPLVPTTPVNTVPVAIPILHLHLMAASCSTNRKPANTALVASS